MRKEEKKRERYEKNEEREGDRRVWRWLESIAQQQSAHCSQHAGSLRMLPSARRVRHAALATPPLLLLAGHVLLKQEKH